MESNLRTLFKCPTCGSTDGKVFGANIKCCSCGNQYKREHDNEEAFAQLYSAYELRLDTEFSKAQAKYNNIISANKEDDAVLEYAYYGKYLCEQRVLFYTTEDGKMIPSFWEISETSYHNSDNFKTALKYAEKSNSYNIDNYIKQAELVEEYKKKYEKVANLKQNYDVFICFKSNKTSIDLGYKLYDDLRDQKYDVFYSPKTLQDKAGQDYEPFIYQALRAAKVMLVLCSSEDDLNSSWVKNEWWRFSHFAKGNNDKIIIPIIMSGFNVAYLPEEIALDGNNAKRQYVEADYSVVSRVRDSVSNHMQIIARNGHIKNSLDYELNEIRNSWNEGKKDAARQKIDVLTQDTGKVNDEHGEAYISAWMLKFRLFSNNYQDLQNDTAEKALEAAKSMAKRHGLQSALRENHDYRDYRAMKRKKAVVKTLVGVLAAGIITAGGIGVYQYMQDPVVDAYITGKPASVQLEYGEGVLSGISSITTVSKKGNEKEVELTNSMISGFDPTKIGVQDIVIRYDDIEIHLSVNVMKYTLTSPVELNFANGQITWKGVQKAQSYTLRINDEVIENVQATSYQDFAFTENGVYTIQVKANADKNFGMDSGYTEAITVVKLGHASNLKRDGMKLTWDPIAGCNSYDIYINGEKAANTNAAFHNLTFDQLAAGENKIYVVPVDEDNIKFKADLSEDELLNYDRNGEIKVSVIQLPQVSNLKRDGLELTWDPVSGSSGYEIFVNDQKVADCGAPSCTLTAEMLTYGENRLCVFPVGERNVKLKEDLSESEKQDPEHTGEITLYRYKQASGLVWKDGQLSWDSVAGATYALYINDELVSRTEQTSYELNGSVEAGNSEVYVLIEGVPYISTTGATDYINNGTISIKKLAQVTDLTIRNKKLTWTAVEDATEYRVFCNGVLVATVKTTNYDVVIDNSQARSDTYTVQACGETGVIFSDISTQSVTIGCLPAPAGVQMNSDILSWNQVAGATGYQIYVGNSLLRVVDADVLSINLLGVLEKGDYKLSVVAVGSGENMLSSAKSQTVSYRVDQTIIYITSEEELRNIVLKLDATYVLGEDITLTEPWTPLGTTATPFTGHFNGNGHTITGLNITATSGQGTGMFGVVGKGAIIEELIINDAICDGGNAYGSVAIVAGINRGTVRNVQVYGDVTAQGSDNVGGIIGTNYGSVYNCVNHASVHGKRYVGGIVGKCDVSDFNLQIFGCSNYGEIQGTYRVGGVMGEVSVMKKTTIYEMHNEGNITATDQYAGGIFGYISGAAGQTGTLNSCSNTGDICADTYAAGCFGYVGAYVKVTVDDILDSSKNCSNSGNITANNHFDEIYVS